MKLNRGSDGASHEFAGPNPVQQPARDWRTGDTRLQTSIRGLLAEKQELARSIPKAASRLDEVNLHVDRFEQLQEVYASDVARLEALEEAGFLLGLSFTRPCPLCGAEPGAQVHAHDHQGIDLVREAALVEIAKIRRQSEDLGATLGILRDEQAYLAEELPRLTDQLGKLEADIADLTPLFVKDRFSSHPTGVLLGHLPNFRYLSLLGRELKPDTIEGRG